MLNRILDMVSSQGTASRCVLYGHPPVRVFIHQNDYSRTMVPTEDITIGYRSSPLYVTPVSDLRLTL